MELERELVETLRDMARDGGVCPTPGPIMEALCDAWLAVQDAPSAEIDYSGDTVTLIAEGSALDNAITDARVEAMHGRRVALVALGE